MLLKVIAVGVLLAQCSALFQQELEDDQQLAVRADGTGVGGIDDLIRELLESLRANMSHGFPQWGIPPLDPLHIDNLTLAFEQPEALRIFANISNGDLTDLSTFVIDDVHVSLLTLKARLALSLPDIKLSCNYFLDGLIAELFPLYGSGPSSVTLGNLSLGVNASLHHNFSGGHDHLQIKDMDFNFHIDSLDIQIHDLFDNDDLAAVIDGFADDFGPLLVDILVNDTRRDLLPTIIEGLNELLWNLSIPLMDELPDLSGDRDLSPGLRSSANADAFFDRLIPYLQSFIQGNKLDPFPLPEFDAEILGNTGVKLYDGSLNGLASCYRGGESQLAYDEVEWLSVSSEIHFQELSAGYRLKLEVFGIGPSVSAEIKLSDTKAKFGAQISSKTLAIALSDLQITDIGGVHVIIRGLGPWEFLAEPIIDLVIDLFKGQIADLVSNALSGTLSDALAKIDLLSILENL